jgi:hypothetical protein
MASDARAYKHVKALSRPRPLARAGVCLLSGRPDCANPGAGPVAVFQPAAARQSRGHVTPACYWIARTQLDDADLLRGVGKADEAARLVGQALETAKTFGFGLWRVERPRSRLSHRPQRCAGEEYGTGANWRYRALGGFKLPALYVPIPGGVLTPRKRWRPAR